jgi:uncharacterized membrane protein YhaH (DUF805 family)
MDQESPYSPPRAGHAAGKDHIVYEEIRPLSLSQRLNRLRYACYQLSAMLVVALAGILLAVFAGSLKSDGDPLKLAIVAVALLMVLAMAIYMIGLMVRRLHDLGHSGWLVLAIFLVSFAPMLVLLLGGGGNLLMFSSLLQPVAMLYLLVAAGQSGMNPYGTPNPPNGILVKVFGGTWWTLSVLITLLSFASIVFSSFAPELLNNLGLETQQQQWEQLERLLKRTGR